jgi:hypothetical protein
MAARLGPRIGTAKSSNCKGATSPTKSHATWLETVAFGGLSKELVREASPAVVAVDSLHPSGGVRFTPPGGVTCTVTFDSATGLPRQSERQPYDDHVIVEFADWRQMGAIRVPFMIREFTAEDSTATTTVGERVELADIPAKQFGALEDGRPDWRFTNGDAALGIPFNFENDHIMIECSVNGRPPLWFMLDTGAGWTCINKTRLAEFGLQAFGDLTVAGGGNSTDISFTRVDRVQVGGVEMLGQRAGVLDMNGLERLYGMPMGGILGYDFVSRFVIRVDYDRKTLDVRVPGAQPDATGERLPLVLERNHPHVRSVIRVPGAEPIPADFIVDCGAAETANLTSPFVRTHDLTTRARKTPAGAPNTIPGMESQFFAQTSVRGKLSSLTLGSIVLSEIPVNLQRGTKGFYARASFSGTIGEGILKRFTTTYDYPHRLLVLEPNGEFAKLFPPRRTFGMTLVSDGADFKRFSVSGVRKGSAAETAGFQKGDVLESLDGKPASTLRLADLRQALLDEGSQHTIEITRGSEARRSLSFVIRLVSIEDN